MKGEYNAAFVSGLVALPVNDLYQDALFDSATVNISFAAGVLQA